jgi:hypothetical protein
MGWYIFVWLSTCVASGILTASLMNQKGRNGVGGFFLGFFLDIFGLLYAAGLPTDRDALNNLLLKKGHYGKCSACYEMVDMNASICPNCHSKLNTKAK